MSTTTARAPRSVRSRIAWSAVGLYVVLVLVGFRLMADVEPLSLLDSWVYFALLWACVIGALIVSRVPRHPIGWLFTGMALSFALGLFTQAYAIYSLIGEPEPLPLTDLAVWVSFWITMPGIAAIALFLPRRTTNSRRRRSRCSGSRSTQGLRPFHPRLARSPAALPRR
jgi:hypothetical protein